MLVSGVSTLDQVGSRPPLALLFQLEESDLSRTDKASIFVEGQAAIDFFRFQQSDGKSPQVVGLQVAVSSAAICR